MKFVSDDSSPTYPIALAFLYFGSHLQVPSANMTERKSYDSAGDLERLVKNESIDLSEQDIDFHINQPRQARRSRIWSILGCSTLLAIVFVIGYLGGARSALDAPRKTPWVAENLGAPYSTCKLKEKKKPVTW